MIIILDAGHGINTKGKRSPDGRLLEYAYCREIRDLIKEKLTKLGYIVAYTVDDEMDIPLKNRCKIVNSICDAQDQDCLLVSIHCNASGDGKQWMKASGWSVFISPNASKKSKILANCLYDEANVRDLKIRKQSPNQKYWIQNLAICRDTKCPAVLTENLFQDNKDDVQFLLSEKGKNIIADLHVQGIINYIKQVRT